MSANGIANGEEGVERLAGALGECTALARLRLELRSNEIGEKGGARLVRVLGECPALELLDLSRNRVDAEGAGRLAGMLQKCSALAHLLLASQYSKRPPPAISPC